VQIVSPQKNREGKKKSEQQQKGTTTGQVTSVYSVVWHGDVRKMKKRTRKEMNRKMKVSSCRVR